MGEIITTDKAKCIGCNKCIMVCPIKYANNVMVVDGERKIEINSSKCIGCGECIKVCEHGARAYLDDADRFWVDLEKSLETGQKISVIVAPSFVANQYDKYKQIFGYLKSLGVNLIYDVSLGADISSWGYVKYMSENKDKIEFAIAQPCPPVVDYIEKYTPNLIDKLIPIQSPVMCSAIYLKKYLGITDKIALIAPCIAKKNEIGRSLNNNLIEYNVPFEGVIAHLASKNINLSDYPEADFDNVQSGLGVHFSRPGGLKENVLYHLPETRIKQIEGRGKVYEYLKYLSLGHRFGSYDLVDILNCEHGCNVGPATSCEKCGVDVSSEFENEILSDKRLKNQNKRKVDYAQYDKLFEYFNETLDINDFEAKYNDNSELAYIPSTSEVDIEKAFALLNKNDEKTRKIDCYSCGYKTCRDMAIAICNKYNVPESCYQYTRKELEHQKHNVEENEKYIRTILEHLTESVIVTDRNGVIEIVNKKTQNIFGHNPDEYVGNHISALIEGIDIDEIEEGVNYEFQVANKFGSFLYLDLQYSKVSFNDKIIFIFIIADKTREKELDNLKTQFVSMVSHELRTPLTSIRGALGLVSSGALGALPDKVKELVNIAGNNSIRLVNLINDILDLEKIKAGKMEFKFDEYEIMPLITETIAFNSEYGRQFDVEYKIQGSLDKALVNVDKDKFVQILTNLLSNAAKFSTPKEDVIIAVGRSSDSIRTSVTNKGMGIPKKSYSKIFESFSQVDSTDSRSKGGTGLGLSICKSIVQKMGGAIGFTSVLNAETTFYFDLPEIHQKEYRENILVCEDDVTTAFCIKKMFEKLGYKVDIACNAKEAKELLSNKEYKLMTLDIILPDKDGLILLDEIRSNEQTSDLPVLVISAKEQDCAEIKKHEIVAWLEKSFGVEELESTISKIMIKKHKNKVKILHIEHNEDILDIVSSTLKMVANITTVNNLADAEKILCDYTFDIIILDYRFPNGTCEQLVKDIKRTHNKNANLIIFSAYEIGSSLAEKVDLVICKTKVSNTQFINCIEPFISQKAKDKDISKGSSQCQN